MRAARALLVSTVTATAVLAGAGVAEARPVIDAPVDCSHGYVMSHGRCVEQLPHNGHPTTVGQWAVAGLGILALAALL